MKPWQTWCGAVVFVAAVMVGSAGWSDDKDKAADKPSAKTAKEATGKSPTKSTTKNAKETKHRLPRYYGKLGLSDSQREKIYGIQAKYDTDIDKLEKQLADLKSKQDADCRKVLDADQKKQLTVLVDAAKVKAAKEDEMEE